MPTEGMRPRVLGSVVAVIAISGMCIPIGFIRTYPLAAAMVVVASSVLAYFFIFPGINAPLFWPLGLVGYDTAMICLCLTSIARKAGAGHFLQLVAFVSGVPLTALCLVTAFWFVSRMAIASNFAAHNKNTQSDDANSP